ncbi:MAG: hypothetical protein AAF533_10195 [Acidobacteriota bacterium]
MSPSSRLERLSLDRRALLRAGAAGALGLGASSLLPGWARASLARPGYAGPKVILVRFGGGVRRQETIGPVEDCWAPYFRHELLKRGTLYSNMVMSEGETSHGEGTLHLLTGEYGAYQDAQEALIGTRFEPPVPTLFEYLRKAFDVPSEQALIVNGEDRKDEEYFNFSNHRLHGIEYRSHTLSLFRFKEHLLRRQLAGGRLTDEEIAAKTKALEEVADLDPRTVGHDLHSPVIEGFWERWRERYGEDGLRNPRGDRLLTELSIRALAELKPKLMMINYQDPDYVHWGNPNHYTWGIKIIDEGLQRLVAAVEADEEYRDDTVFIVVPDCGRSANPLIPVPYQHHFPGRSSREIFAFVMGPKVPAGQRIEREVEQVDVTSTIGTLMGFDTEHATGGVLPEVFS